MADYIDNISTSDYPYIKDFTITEIAGEDHTNLVVKLSLTSSNFNFSLARSDGADFRIGETSNGSGIFNMWIAAWSESNEIGTIWLKIPNLLSNETKTLYAYWGYLSASGVSNIDEIGFLFADGFEGVSLDQTKWVNEGIASLEDSIVVIGDVSGSYIEAKGNPLSGITEWIVEEGVYVSLYDSNTTNACHRYRFYGTENDFGFNFYREGSNDRQHNVLDSSTWVYYDGVGRGFDDSGYSENYIAYKESTDHVYQGMTKRPNLSDYHDSWERQVYGDTRITYFRIYCRSNTSAHKIGIDWIIVREYVEEDPYVFNTSNLYVPYEAIDHETINLEEYDFDVTSINFYHTTSSGGDPYKLSDNILSSINNCWYNDVLYETTTPIQGEVQLSIDFGRGSEDSNLVSTKYIHYDDGHVGYNNASKLSDSNSNTYFQGTTSSGYVCIDFGDNNIEIGCLVVKAKYGNLTGMVKNFIFSGSYKNPRIDNDSNWTVLYSGEFEQVVDPQPIYFVNENPYRYYKLKVLDTYGSNTMLQEWQMYQYDESKKKMVISQVRLNPVAFDLQEKYFPKHISLRASNDAINWTELASTRSVDGTWIYSSGPPTSAIGAFGDYYMDIDNGNVYQKINVGYTDDLTEGGTWSCSAGSWGSCTSVWTGGWGSSGLRITGTSNIYCRYNFTQPRKIEKYGMACPGGNNSPRSWNFQGYIGGSWVTLQTVTDWDFGEEYAPLFWEVENNDYAEYYRVYITQNAGDSSYTQVNQIEMYEKAINWELLYTQPYGSVRTATPFYDYVWGRWQRFSFTNETPYYNYKLICYGNWNDNVGPIAIAEWEMVEKTYEARSYRILDGSSNDFSSVWAANNTTFDDGFIYIGDGGFLNTIYNNRLISSVTVSGIVDINTI